jgi:hypothetical protein
VTDIIVALIVGGLSLLGVILTNASSNKKVESKIETAQAVTDAKIEELTREVREHNNFARRVPVLESQMQDISRRLGNVEK